MCEENSLNRIFAFSPIVSMLIIGPVNALQTGKLRLFPPPMMQIFRHFVGSDCISSFCILYYIFYANSKSKNQLMYFSISINKPRLC